MTASLDTRPATTDEGTDYFTEALMQARKDWTDAKADQSAKDTPAHRAAVTHARDCLDALLDMYLVTR